MHVKFTARVEQTIHHQQSQHLLPTNCFTRFRQTLLPELIQTELMPQITGQPATAEGSWPPKFEPTQPHGHAIHRVGRNLAIIREQTQGGVALLLLVEDLQCLAPGYLLLIINLAQIQHGSLYRLTARYAAILHDTEVAVVLAVLPAVGAAEKHRKQKSARNFGF